MNISFLTGTAAWGGAEAHTVELARTLAVRGHEVTIVALGHGVYDEVGRRPGAPFKVRHLQLGKSVRQLTWTECRAIVDDLPQGIGVLVRWGLSVGSLRLDLAARLRFRRYIAIEHSAAVLPSRTKSMPSRHLLQGWGLWWYQGVLLWHLRSALTDSVVCVSQAARRRMIREFRVPGQKVVTVYNGIDAQLFQAHAESREAARRQWGVPNDALVFGSVGRLHADKGLDLAIEGLGQLATRYPQHDLRLVLVGEGPAKETLQDSARRLGIADRVVFAGFCTKPWEAYPGMDCFLLPSLDEALPLGLIEAMACGCCSVAMGVGGVPEVLSDPRAGWLVPAEDRPRFLQAMDAAVGLGADRRAEMGRKARANVVKRFDAARQYAAVADIIEHGHTNPKR